MSYRTNRKTRTRFPVIFGNPGMMRGTEVCARPDCGHSAFQHGSRGCEVGEPHCPAFVIGISPNNPPVGALGHERYTCALCGVGVVQGTETEFDDTIICPRCAREVERDEASGVIARDTRDE